MGRIKLSRQVYSALILTSFLSSPTFAKADSQPDFVSIDAQVRMGVEDTDANGVKAQVLDAEVGVKVNITEFLKANFKLEMSQDIDKWEDLLEEAYFVIDVDKTGAPVIHAILDEVSIGQMNQSTGQNKKIIPFYRENLMYAIEVDERVTGATFVLDNNLVSQLVDKIELSVYKSGDGSFLSTDGNTVLTAKVRKDFKDVILKGSSLQVLASIKNESLDSEDDRRQLGLGLDYIFDRWNAYAQVILMENNEQNPDADYVLNGGLSMKLSERISIGGDITHLDKEALSGGSRTDYIGYFKYKPMRGMEVGLQLTQRQRENGKNETIPGVVTTLSMDRQATGELIKTKK